MIDLPDEITQESNLPKVKLVNDEEKVQFSGDIRFENYTMSYRKDLPKILDNFTVNIPQGKKVGIVGRTGAGKSSFMQALFRMVYHRDGDILIGGRSIFSADISSVRSSFGVVPQDPYLFAGTIRFNLAGNLQDVSDARLLAALRTVNLDVDLDAQVQEGGKDYSVGERQLLCIARLILLDKQYILMDEPTSSLDRKTDEQMQRLMRTVLADKTVITIAHRLESLEHYDLILEMAGGRLLREGTPAELIPALRSQYVA
jgi:ABC-type multidrug transport system fused ATPase/permease subunit